MLKKQASFSRGERIASGVQKHVAEILRDYNSEDPVVSRVSVSGVGAEGAPQFVKIFYHVHGGGTEDIQRRLDSITPSVRRELAQRMNQKYVSDIRFVYDDTLEKSARIDELLAAIAGDSDE